MKLSLVIPVYNEERQIRECLEHIIGQTRPVDECVIVDNNSTDETLRIVSEFGGRLPIRVIVEKRQGVAWARRAGAIAATGEILGQIDADSRLEADWAETVDAYFTNNPEVDGVSDPFYFFDSPMTDRARRKVRENAERHGHSDVGGTTGLSGGNSALRRTAWLRAEPLMKNLARTHEDVDLSYALRESNAQLRHLPGMIVSISTRRYEASMASNWKYLSATIRTQRAHGDHKAAAIQTALLPINMVQFSIAGLVFRPYDPETKQWKPWSRRTRDRVSPVTS